MPDADDAPEGWSAVEMTDLIGHDRHIEVSGTVEAVVTDRVFLQRAQPQGTAPNDLILDLIERRRAPIGGGAIAPRTVRYAHTISRHQYATVTVRRGAAVVAHVKVEEVLT